MKPQRPQRGNPQRLTFWQHVFPANGIMRFAGTDSNVAVKHRQSKEEFRLSPRNSLFCARRAWDERAETGYMKQIELEFQALAEEIITGRRHLNPLDCSIVSRFLALWCFRFHFRHNPIPDHPVFGIVGEPLRQDQEEVLEKNRIAFFRQNQTMSGRFLTGVQIQTMIIKFESDYRDVIWGVARAIKGEFILPDTFAGFPVVPITPRISLICNVKDIDLPDVEVARVNRQGMKSARDYCIARDFTMCPV